MIQMFSALFALLFAAQPAQDAPAASAPSPQSGVRVVELFTSQGCPMCPGANELLADLAQADPQVLALAYGVDYWDIYGWRDTFAMDSFTARQQAYVHAGEARRVYTPHFVISGSPDKLRFSAPTVRAAVSASPVLPALIEARRTGAAIHVRLDGPARDTAARIWAVAYHDGVETRLIEDGPNAGREMLHYNMVRSIEPVADWAGGALELSIEAPGAALAAAILVQDGPGGRILSAARAE
jgi:hypothetical protein